MPDKLIPGEKKTPVYKKQKVGEGKTPFQMKGSPMQRNFNIGIANKAGLSGLATKDSPMQWAFLVPIGKAIAAAAKGVAKGAVAAGKAVAKGAVTAGKAIGKFGKTIGKTKVGKAISKFGKSKLGKGMGQTLGANIVQNIGASGSRREEHKNSPSATFAGMKFGTGGSTPFSFKQAHNKEIMLKSLTKNKAYLKYKSSTPQMSEFIQSTSPY